MIIFSGINLFAQKDTALKIPSASILQIRLFSVAKKEFLSENNPGYDRVLDGEDFKKTGTIKTMDLGFRYMINVGFRS